MTKKTLDDFIDVLRWSTRFGADTESGRDLKKSVIPVFGAGAFNPKGRVLINEREYTLAQYAKMLNIKLLRPSDFNKQLRERGVDKKVTVQKISKACRDERNIREMLDNVWMKPERAPEILNEFIAANQDVFEFEYSLSF